MATPHDTRGGRGSTRAPKPWSWAAADPSLPRIVAPARPQTAGVSAMMGAVSTRTLIVLAAACAIVILAASAIQILLAR
jgi:hypothetical protein